MPKKPKGPDLGFHRWFGGARYLGGHSAFSEGWVGYLFFTTEAIGLGKTIYTGPQETVIPMRTVTSIQITGLQVAKSRVGPVLAFGVLGLGAKATTHNTTVVVRTEDGETVFFSIDNQVPDQVRAVLIPLLNHLKVPMYEDDATRSYIAPKLD
jgi:hypothetical protein